ncbi:MAG: prepilin peptidase [Anaerolineales bacterium]|nr:prepilin peptidase [Anaerolineales bacterium]
MNSSLLIALALGWLSGLFVNYASDVLPRTRRFSQPVCRNCETQFSWLDYLTLRACRNCGIMRNLRTWIVQLVMTASFAYFWLNTPPALGLPLSLIVLTYFAVIAVIDIEHRLILFPTSVFGAALGLIVGTYVYFVAKKLSFPIAVGSSLLGGLIGFGIMFLVYQLGTLVARYRARKLQAAGQADDEEEAFGGGDVYLGGVIGLMLGWEFILMGLTIGILFGGLVSLMLIVASLIQRKYFSQSFMVFIPYGPYLIAGAFYMLYFG